MENSISGARVFGELPFPVLPKTMREAQDEGSILGTFRSQHLPVHFAVTRHKFMGPVSFQPSDYSGYNDPNPDMNYILYQVYEINTTGLEVRPGDEIVPIGGILFRTNEGKWDDPLGEYKDAIVAYSGLDRSYRGMGVGGAMYRIAINDLIDQGYTVSSDIELSEAARGVWESIRRKNRSRVERTGERVYPDDPVIYTAMGYVARRPVHVRGHRRRA